MWKHLKVNAEMIGGRLLAVDLLGARRIAGALACPRMRGGHGDA